MASKVDRLGRAVRNLARGPPRSEEAAAASLWGKDSADKPDGDQVNAILYDLPGCLLRMLGRMGSGEEGG